MSAQRAAGGARVRRPSFARFCARLSNCRARALATQKQQSQTPLLPPFKSPTNCTHSSFTSTAGRQIQQVRQEVSIFFFFSLLPLLWPTSTIGLRAQTPPSAPGQLGESAALSSHRVRARWSCNYAILCSCAQVQSNTTPTG